MGLGVVGNIVASRPSVVIRPTPCLHWFVIWTAPRAEADAIQDIERLGFKTYCPLEKCRRFRRNRREIFTRPLFPRYAFVQFDPHGPWSEIRHADGVVDLLRNDNQPMRLPEGFVESLQHMQQLGLFDHTKLPAPFPIGSQVMLDASGPFAELVGKVRRARSRERVDVLIHYLNREVVVNVPIMRLSAAAQAA